MADGSGWGRGCVVVPGPLGAPKPGGQGVWQLQSRINQEPYQESPSEVDRVWW